MKSTHDPVISKWRQRMIPWSQNEDNLWSRDLNIIKKNDLVIWEFIIFVILWSQNGANLWSRDLRINKWNAGFFFLRENHFGRESQFWPYFWCFSRAKIVYHAHLFHFFSDFLRPSNFLFQRWKFKFFTLYKNYVWYKISFLKKFHGQKLVFRGTFRGLWSCDLRYEKKMILWSEIRKKNDLVIWETEKKVILWSEMQEKKWSCDLRYGKLCDLVIWNLNNNVILWSGIRK